MKTKKAIFEWWIERGKLTDFKLNSLDYLDYKDLENFKTRIQIPFEELKTNGVHTTIKVLPPRCKYPMHLCFYKSECFKIIGF